MIRLAYFPSLKDQNPALPVTEYLKRVFRLFGLVPSCLWLEGIIAINPSWAEAEILKKMLFNLFFLSITTSFILSTANSFQLPPWSFIAAAYDRLLNNTGVEGMDLPAVENLGLTFDYRHPKLNC